jgi:TrwC relaxase
MLGTVAQGKDEYYAGCGEAPGNWGGERDLGLSGEVASDELREVLAGISPDDGSLLLLTRRVGSSRVSGFHLTFSALTWSFECAPRDSNPKPAD